MNKIEHLSNDQLLQRLEQLLAEQGDAGDGTRLLHELQVHQVELEMQNRELREMQQELEHSHNRYVDLYDFSPVGYLTLNAKGAIQEINLMASQLLGRERIKLLGKLFFPFLDQGSQLHLLTHLRQVFGSIERHTVELHLKAGIDDTRIIRMESIMAPENSYNIPSCRCALLDITESYADRIALEESRRQIEQAHREWVDAFDSVDPPVFLHDREGRILRANRAYAEAGGQPLQELAGHYYWEIFPLHDGPLLGCREVILGNLDGAEHEEKLEIKGRTFISKSFAIRDEQGDYSYSIHILTDITLQEEAERDLQKQQELLQKVMETIPHGVFWKDRTSTYLGCNANFARDAGLAHPNEVVGKSDYDLPWNPEDTELYRSIDLKVMESGKSQRNIEEPIHKADGSDSILLTSKAPLRDANEQVMGMLGIYTDISELKHKEQQLVESSREITFKNRIAGIFLSHPGEEVYGELLPILLEALESRYGAFGYLDEEGNLVLPSLTYTVWDQNQIPDKTFTFPPETWGDSSWGKAIREQRANYSNEKSHKTLEDHIPIERHISLPLIFQGKSTGLLMVANKETDYVDADVDKLQSFADYIAPILHARLAQQQQEQARKEADVALQASLEGTINAVAKAVEVRDPYTAGHQKRVADLAISIAKLLGFDELRLKGIHMGGLIHDIGKIHIPAEILSKPARLSRVEFEMIKSHPEVGYEILKDIAFPWPVAEIAHQHHERLDGSGYPQGLKGDKISLEARIVAVADVVEAISSHRPYRPALGIEAALEEIHKQRGVLYDPDAVDACMKLFSDDKFSF